MTKDTLLALAVRCEALEGEDYQLDTEIALAFDEASLDTQTSEEIGDFTMLLDADGQGPYCPHYTCSLDACRELRERVLPGHRVEIWQGAYDDWECFLRNPVGRIASYSICARTEEGARLAAMLRAKAKET